MKTRFSFAIVASLFAASCSAPQFAVEATYGRLEPSGDLALTSSGNPVTRNSLDGIGIEDEESSIGLRADFEWGIPHVTLATQDADWSGSGTVTNFGGIPGANVAVDSTMDVAIHRGLVTFDVLPVPMVELGLGLGVAVIDFEAEVQDQANNFPPENIDEVLPVPVLVVRGGLNVWRLEFEAMVAGMSVDIDGNEATYFDTDVSARLRLLDVGPVDAFLTAGYRRIDVDAEYEDGNEDVKADFTLDGLYVGLRVSV
ncbi:MAG TPA: hypothetical protein VK843_21250 [Planctomycetota bacterium]|nr:hypothetical protein [Planctomycetota bacterium]